MAGARGQPPRWLTKFLGRAADGAPLDEATRLEPRLGTVVLKPKGAPSPAGREITMAPQQAAPVTYVPVDRAAPRKGPKQLTPAAMVYALAAGILFALAIYNVVNGSLFNGIVTFIPAASLAVLSYKYIQ